MSLRVELEKQTYTADWGFLGDFAFGAPLFADDRKRVFLDMFDSVRKSVAIQHPQLDTAQKADQDKIDWLTCDRVVGVLVEVLQRATEKSVGLLQALAILAAVIAILMPSASAGDSPIVVELGHFTLGFTLLATLLLFANVGLTWRRQKNFFTKPSLRLKELYAMLLVRSHRLRLVQVLAFICFLLTFVVTLYRAEQAMPLWNFQGLLNMRGWMATLFAV